MALNEEGGAGIPATMLVGPATYGNAGTPYPVYMGGGNNGGIGNSFGNDGWWIVLLFILLAGRGWGGYGEGNGNGGGTPIIVNEGNNGYGVQRGFDQAAIISGINEVENGVQSLSTQLCGCCADMAQTVNSGFANAETAANARQMSLLQQAFAGQTAMAQGFNDLGSRFADCCCENRLATADLKYTIATENCADRAALSDGVRDIITNQNSGVQRILDQLCADKIDAKNEKIADLERQLTMANLAASQTAQTARLETSNIATVDALYTRLSQCPVPCMPVYGMQPIFTCGGNNSGCGCGGNNGF